MYQADSGSLHGAGSAVNGIKERYLFYLVPLIGICFALYARRGWPLRVPHLLLAGGLFVVSVRVPLSGFAVSATLDGSPILYGVYWLAGRLDNTSAASLAVAVAAACLLAVAVGTSRRPRLATPLALALALLATAATSAGAVAFSITTTAAAKRTYLPRDASFVDHSGLRPRRTRSRAGAALRSAALQQLFWNRSRRPRAPAARRGPDRRLRSRAGHGRRRRVAARGRARDPDPPPRRRLRLDGAPPRRPPGRERARVDALGPGRERRGSPSTPRGATTTAGWRATARSRSGRPRRAQGSAAG